MTQFRSALSSPQRTSKAPASLRLHHQSQRTKMAKLSIYQSSYFSLPISLVSSFLQNCCGSLLSASASSCLFKGVPDLVWSCEVGFLNHGNNYIIIHLSCLLCFSGLLVLPNCWVYSFSHLSDWFIWGFQPDNGLLHLHWHLRYDVCLIYHEITKGQASLEDCVQKWISTTEIPDVRCQQSPPINIFQSRDKRPEASSTVSGKWTI